MGEDYKDEFLRVIGRDGIRCAEIFHDAGLPEDGELEIYSLREGYTKEEFEEFLGELEGKRTIIGYSELFGCVWMKDGSWYRRGYENVIDWWELVKVPEIPSYLKKSGDEGSEK